MAKKEKERKFTECENILNRLMYHGPASSLLEVDFDINSEPSIRVIDGLACLEGLPKEDEKILLEKVKKKYPNGFHSRNNMAMEWLKNRLEELATNHSVTIKAIEPYGCLMIEGDNYDAYKVDIEHNVKSTVYVAITSFQRSFIVFRPYIQYEEFGDSQNIGMFQYESEPMDSKSDKTIFFSQEIVSFRAYFYTQGNILEEEGFGFKNKEIGFLNESKFGEFMPAGAVKYVI